MHLLSPDASILKIIVAVSRQLLPLLCLIYVVCKTILGEIREVLVIVNLFNSINYHSVDIKTYTFGKNHLGDQGC